MDGGFAKRYSLPFEGAALRTSSANNLPTTSTAGFNEHKKDSPLGMNHLLDSGSHLSSIRFAAAHRAQAEAVAFDQKPPGMSSQQTLYHSFPAYRHVSCSRLPTSRVYPPPGLALRFCQHIELSLAGSSRPHRFQHAQLLT